jgi:hypothetical protein
MYLMACYNVRSVTAGAAGLPQVPTDLIAVFAAAQTIEALNRVGGEPFSVGKIGCISHGLAV